MPGVNRSTNSTAASCRSEAAPQDDIRGTCQDDTGRALTFKDTSAWRKRNPLFRIVSGVAGGLTGRADGRPRSIRQWAPWPGTLAWRAACKISGVQESQPAAGPQTLIWNSDEDAHIQLESAPKSNEKISDKDGREFDWAFCKRVELEYSARSRFLGGPSKQKLVGFAYTVKEKAEIKTGSNFSNNIGGAAASKNFSNAECAPVPNFTQNDRPVVVYFGGHGLPVEQQSTPLGGCTGEDYVIQKRANFLALNYRGYGASSGGVPSNRTMVEDGVAILNHLLDSGIDPERIVLHGYSMGGNIAANVLQAAEARGLKLGGLILDRPMEKLATGAAALTRTRSKNIFKKICLNYVQAPVVWLVVKCLAESYNTSASLKSLLKSRDQNKEWTPIAGVYDNHPIGSTSRRMLETRGIACTDTKDTHGASLEKTFAALDKLHDAARLDNYDDDDDTDILRLYKTFERRYAGMSGKTMELSEPKIQPTGDSFAVFGSTVQNFRQKLEIPDGSTNELHETGT